MAKKTPKEKPTLENLVDSGKTRPSLTRASHQAFFAVYFNHYITHEVAPFHREMFELSERQDLKMLIVEAFRGSGKSTIMTTSYPIWAVLGAPKKKFVILLSQTQKQAKQHFMNLKRELEGNAVLRRDLGPFEPEDDEWGSGSLVLPKYGARITFASSEQSIRGLRHRQHRPDLIICDDVEDVQSARTKESRDKIYEWFTGDVVPCGDERTRIVVVGNLVHEDGLLTRLEGMISAKLISGEFRRYPLLDERGRCLWKSRFPTADSVKELKARVGSEVAWQREYLLRIMADEERVIHREWIQYYDGMPDFGGSDFLFGVTAVDLAISEKHHGDYTAIVSAAVFKDGKGGRRVYIMPHPINKRMDFPTAIECIKSVSCSVLPNGRTELVIESVAFQAAYVQDIKRQGYHAHPYEVRGRDKRTRLALTSAHVQSGTVLFPREGSKELSGHLVNFGIEKHDDLPDAFSMCVDYAMTRKYTTFSITYLGPDRPELRYGMGDLFPRGR